MRRDFDRHSERIKTILIEAIIRKTFLDAAPEKAASVVKAFAKNNARNALKTKPKVCCHLFMFA